ncbi:hypothetical protein [Brevibacillus brevis]|uniref:hypothetical protein n=1 Tax=Brevibacillus brevis TaxID=1393 RepID=UPI001C8D8F91|nr:hypothetical protein [Brevibacillus brevis]MBY0088104.1 hypothetical protein [Brevibacillus brevis]
MNGKYLFVSRHEFKFSDIKPIRNRHSKPFGGLWTSSFCEEAGSEWLQSQLCYLADGAKGYVFESDPNSKFLNVYTVAEALAVLDEYCIEKTTMNRRDGSEYALGIYKIDFELMAERFDAIHVKGEAVQIYKQHHGRYSPFADWSVDSILWFNTERIKLIDTLEYHTLSSLKR